MKKSFLTLVAVLCLGVLRTLGHGGVELGPNGGRLVEFSKDHTLHGEVVLKEGKFHVTILDKALKPVALTEQTLAVTGGSRNKPEKPKVEKVGDQFVFPALKGDSYLLAFQFKAGPSAKAVTARIEFDASTCSGCQQAEWLCKCPPAKDAKKATGSDK